MQEYYRFFEENAVWSWAMSFVGGLVFGYVLFGLWLKARGKTGFMSYLVYIALAWFFLLAVEAGLFPNRVEFFKFFFVGILFCDYNNYRRERKLAARRAIMGEPREEEEGEVGE